MPFVLLGPFAGLLADRWPRKRIMIVADVARAAIIIGVRSVFLGFHEQMSPWALMALLFVGGVMNLAVIAALTVFVGFEKLGPFGVRTSRVSGALLIGAGVWMLLA